MSVKDAPANRNTGHKLTRFLQIRKLHYLLVLALILVMTSYAMAQSPPSEQLPEVYIGSVENEVLLSLTFEDETEENAELKLVLEESFGVASNVKIVERKNLSSISGPVFAISFDIATDVEPGTVEKLIFVPSSSQLLSYDKDSLQFSFRTIAEEQETATASNGDKLVLVLKSILYNDDTHKKTEGVPYDQDGFSVENCPFDDCEQYSNRTYALTVEEYPEKIIIGKPFSFKVKAVKRHVLKHGNRGGTLGYAEPVEASIFFEPVFPPMGSKPISLYVYGAGKKTLTPDLKRLDPGKNVFIFEGWADEDTLDLEIKMGFTRIWSDHLSFWEAAVYDVMETDTNGVFASYFYIEPSPYPANKTLAVTYTAGTAHDKGDIGLKVHIARHNDFDTHAPPIAHKQERQILTFVYEFGSPEDKAKVAKKFPFPDSLNTPLEVAKGGPQSDQGDNGSGGNGEKSSAVNDTVKDQIKDKLAGHSTGGVTGSDDKGNITGRSKPGSINPKNPEVADLIKEWIGQAEPVANASGASLHFDKWGRMEGRAVGGIITINSKPDNVSGRSPEKYVWDIRDKLDSVDHCTLGEYVTAKLGDKSLSHCVGRHKPKVANVSGMSKKGAEGKLQSTGLKTKVSLGSPASTAKDSLKVEKTIPDIGSTVNRGSMVTIVIHTPFVDKRIVPEFGSASAKEVMKKIKNTGLTPKINIVKATSSEQTGKVRALEPPPGTELKAGATVLVNVFGPFVRTISVPDVIGSKAKKAMSKIKDAGLKPKISIVKATSSEQTGRVSALDPSPGTELKAGATVLVSVFGPFVRTISIPDVKGFTENEARDKLASLGLQLNITGSKATEDSLLAGTVRSQMPEAGTTVKEGKSIEIVVYKQSRPDCSKWTGSAPLWNQKKQKYECDCTGDYERNNANNACRLKKEIQVANASCPAGTHPKWSKEREEARCYCDEGSWDSSKGRCVTEREKALAGLTCPSCETPYYDKTKRKARCVCASGCDYDSTISSYCMPQEKLARLQRQNQQAQEERNRQWEEEQRRQKRQEEAERQRDCQKYLGQLNNSVLKKRKQWEQMVYLTGLYASNCDSSEILAAQQGKWRGGRSGGSGTGGGGSVKDKVEGRGRVSSSYVNICVVDSNSILDDHYDMLVNNMFVGAIKNPKGGRTCYDTYLNSGVNRVELRLNRKMGKSTALTIHINNNEYKKGFSGSHNHIWEIEAP